MILISIYDQRFPAAVLLAALATIGGCGRPSAASSANGQAAASAEPAQESFADRVADTTDTTNESNGAIETKETVADQPATVPPAPRRPPADRTARRPGEAEKITFEDLNLGMQMDVVFREFMLLNNERVKELDGKRVSLTGYMHPGVASSRGIKEFILLRNKECKFGPGGQADHLAQVYLRTGETTDFTPGPVKVEANLKVTDFRGPDDNTWAIYRLEDAVIR